MATKTFYAIKEAVVANGQTALNEATNKGAGRDYHLPAGNIVLGGTATNNDVRSLVQFSLDFSDVASITSATLYLTTARASDGVVAGYSRDAHGTYAAGTTYVAKLTSSWTAGVRGNDELWYTDNAVTWANKPSFTTNNRATIVNTSTRPSNPTQVSVGVTGILNDWFSQPSNNYGIQIYSSSETGNGFQEYYSSHAESDGFIVGATGPYIVLTYAEVSATSKSPSIIPVTPVNNGIAKIANINAYDQWSSSSYLAAPYLSWKIVLGSSGKPIANWRMRLYEGSGTAGSMVFDSGSVTSEPYLSYTSVSLDNTNPAWAGGSGWTDPTRPGLANGSIYTWVTNVADTRGSVGASTVSFKTRWSQAIYEFDVGSSWLQTSQWDVFANSPEKNTQFGLIHRALSAPGGRNETALLSYAKGDASSMTYFHSAKNSYITGVNSANGTEVTFAGTNTFAAGDYISIAGISTSTQYNLSNVSVSSASGTTFTVLAASTGTFSHTGNNRPYAFSAHPFNYGQIVSVSGVTTSAGSNTYNVTRVPVGAVSSNQSGTITNVTFPGSGTVRYSATNGYSAGDRVTIYGVNPIDHNLANATVSTATSTYFEVLSAATAAYVTSAGRAFALTSKVNLPGSATYSSGGTVSVAWTEISSIIAAGRYLNTTVRMSSNDGINQPVLTSLYFEYADSALAADNWFSTGGTSVLDSSVRRFGTKSLRFTANSTALISEAYQVIGASGDGTIITYVSNNNFAAGNVVTVTGVSPSSYNIAGGTIQTVSATGFTLAGTVTDTFTGSGQVSRTQYDSYIAAGDAYSNTADVTVVPNTDYSYSVYVKPNIIYGGNEIRARVYEGGTALGAIIADSGAHTSYLPDNEGWYRLQATFNTGSGRTSVRPTIYLANNAGVSGNSFWSDGAQLEEGNVVRSWTPGFVTSGITMEGGGLKVDAVGGGSFRLRGSANTSRSIVELGDKGLAFGGDINPVQIYSPSSSLLATDSSLTVGGSLIAGTASIDGNISIAGSAIFGGDASVYRSSANKLGINNNLLVGGTVEFGSLADTNIYRSAANYLKSDDVFFPANIAAGIVTQIWTTEDVQSVTGLSVLSSAGTAGGTANFIILAQPWRTTSAQSITDTFAWMIRPGSHTFSSGRLTGFTLYTTENAAYEPDGFYWMVMGI